MFGIKYDFWLAHSQSTERIKEGSVFQGNRIVYFYNRWYHESTQSIEEILLLVLVIVAVYVEFKTPPEYCLTT